MQLNYLISDQLECCWRDAAANHVAGLHQHKQITAAYCCWHPLCCQQ